MKLEWDERKNRANVRKHGFDFADAELAFTGPMFFRPDTREEYGEGRWLGIGSVRGIIVAVAFAERGTDRLRIISLRRANAQERQEFEKEVTDRLGPGSPDD